jgi:chaperonin GroEL
VEDALNATRAAVEEGIVPGGGIALLRSSKVLANFKESNEDRQAGVDIIRRACQSPVRQIAFNAGEEPSVVVDKIISKDDTNWGFNAATEEYTDLVKAGVIDPVKVVRSALQNAASVSSLLLTTEAMIAEKPKKESSPSMPDMGGGMGGMGGMM